MPDKINSSEARSCVLLGIHRWSNDPKRYDNWGENSDEGQYIVDENCGSSPEHPLEISPGDYELILHHMADIPIDDPIHSTGEAPKKKYRRPQWHFEWNNEQDLRSVMPVYGHVEMKIVISRMDANQPQPKPQFIIPVVGLSGNWVTVVPKVTMKPSKEVYNLMTVGDVSQLFLNNFGKPILKFKPGNLNYYVRVPFPKSG